MVTSMCPPRTIENEVELFGAHPIDRYLFILLLTESGMGGLEHANSSALAWPSLKFRPSIEYHRFLTLVAHEYFHLWNVKRIRPEVFLQYDYSREVYTRLLWVFEGITNYYDELIPLRAGVYDTKRYLGFLAENTQGEAARPGREVQSVAESSFDTWIKLYRPSPDSANSQVSYYQRGQLVALLLDLHIRTQTEDKKSLDDVLRHLYQHIYQAGRGLGEDEFPACVQTATGVDVEDFLATYVNGTATLEYEAAFQHVGLQLRPKPQKPEQKRGWLGASVQKKEGGSVLAGVRVGGSAHAAGLMAGDEVIALDGHRVRTDLDGRLKLYRSGETAKWVVFRQGRLLEGELTFMENPYPPLELVPVDEPTDAQRASFLAWTHVELKPPSRTEDSD